MTGQATFVTNRTTQNKPSGSSMTTSSLGFCSFMPCSSIETPSVSPTTFHSTLSPSLIAVASRGVAYQYSGLNFLPSTSKHAVNTLVAPPGAHQSRCLEKHDVLSDRSGKSWPGYDIVVQEKS